MGSGQKILVVEDDANVAKLVSKVLTEEGYLVRIASDGASGIRLATEEVPSLVLLDMTLPKLDGLEVCRKLKANGATNRVPVVFLTAKGEETDIVLGLGVGGDDYIRKPFNVKDLVARVAAVLRRSEGGSHEAAGKRLLRGPIEVDEEKLEARIGGELIPLTVCEFRIFWKLVERPGVVLTREQLLDAIGDSTSAVVDRNVDVHVASIRKKMGVHGKLIGTVRGIGYKFKEN